AGGRYVSLLARGGLSYLLRAFARRLLRQPGGSVRLAGGRAEVGRAAAWLHRPLRGGTFGGAALCVAAVVGPGLSVVFAGGRSGTVRSRRHAATVCLRRILDPVVVPVRARQAV